MRTIVCMKPGEAGLGLFEEIQALHSDSVFWPAFKFEKSPHFSDSRDLILKSAQQGALLILVSPTTVKFMKEIFPWLDKNSSFGCVGEPTARALLKTFPAAASVLFPHGSSLESGSELLLHQLQKEGIPPRAVVIRAETGRDFLIEELTKAGSDVRVAPLYKRIPLTASEEQKQWVGKGDAPVIYITSTDSADILLRNVGERAAPWIVNAEIITIHPRIEGHLRELGFQRISLLDSKDPKTAQKLVSLARNTMSD